MSSLLEISPVLWRKKLRQASFKNAAFHVETQGRVSGRRTVVHEYPKLDIPWAEDLGRQAVRYQITGYVIQRWRPKPGAPQRFGNMPYNYDEARDRLIAALEDQGPGRLVDPYNNTIGPEFFQCERYSLTESRERGGYAQFEMAFVEAGVQVEAVPLVNTLTAVIYAGTKATVAAADQMNLALALAQRPGGAGQQLRRVF
jgi:prophage DNA circulation protein